MTDIADGEYWVKFIDEELNAHEYMVKKIGKKWYFIDGTGWKDEIGYSEEEMSKAIISIRPVDHSLPEIKPDYNYGPLTYPLSQYANLFRRK